VKSCKARAATNGADVIDIREEDVKLIDDRIEIISTKEQEIVEKRKKRS
jgi:hypothetical protein